jgi:hypothetical protein
MDTCNPTKQLEELLLRNGPPYRNPLDGRLLSDLTGRQLEAVLTRYPFLRQVAPSLKDPNEVPKWDVRSYFEGQRVVAPEEAALLRDPTPIRKAPTKREPRRHRDSERALAAAYHEGGHCVVGLLLGLRIPSATILPEKGSDGHTIIEATDDRGVNCCIDLAGQVADEMSGVPMSSDNYRTDNKNWPAEMRSELKPLVRKYLTEAWGAVDEIAKRLLLREMLDEFSIRSAFEIGLRKWRAKHRVLATANATKAAPRPGRVVRTWNMDNDADAADFARRLGVQHDYELIGTTNGPIARKRQ